MYYLTGYDTGGYSLFQCLILRADGDLVLVTRSADKLQGCPHLHDSRRSHLDRQRRCPIPPTMSSRCSRKRAWPANMSASNFTPGA